MMKLKLNQKHTHRVALCDEAILIYNTHKYMSDKGGETEAEP